MAIIKFFKTYLFRKDIHYKVLEKIKLFNRRNFKNAIIDQQVLISEKKNVIIFDVGAHIGETIKKYKSTFPNSKIYAFEPYPNSYKFLKGSHELLTKEKIGLIYIEWQVVPLYENHSLYFEIGSILKQYGFELFNFYNVNEARSGQIRRADAIYTSPALRKKLVSKYGKGQGSGW